MRQFRVQVQDEAAEDLIEIWAEIAVHNPLAADKYLGKLDGRIDSLYLMPERGVPRDNLLPGLRMLAEGNHMIYYRVSNKRVEIMRVIHGSQDTTRLFS